MAVGFHKKTWPRRQLPVAKAIRFQARPFPAALDSLVFFQHYPKRSSVVAGFTWLVAVVYCSLRTLHMPSTALPPSSRAKAKHGLPPQSLIRPAPQWEALGLAGISKTARRRHQVIRRELRPRPPPRQPVSARLLIESPRSQYGAAPSSLVKRFSRKTLNATRSCVFVEGGLHHTNPYREPFFLEKRWFELSPNLTSPSPTVP